MRKIEISGRVAACASALVLASSALAACGGSSGTTHNSSSTAHAGTSSTAMGTSSTATQSTLGSSTSSSNKALSAKTRAQIAQRLRSLRSRAASSHATVAPAVQQTAFRTALAHFADCLRQQGVKIPMPSSKGPVLSTRGLNTNSPQYRSALKKCRGVLVAAFRQAAHARR